MQNKIWPTLPYPEWEDTCTTLHMWTQIVGKVRLALTPWLNHSWHVTLYPTVRGLTTSPIPCGSSAFQIDFDFLSQELVVARDNGESKRLPLQPQTVADFFKELMAALGEIGVEAKFSLKPNEVPTPIPFPEDQVHRAYDGYAAERFWRILLTTHRVFFEFRSAFLGKVSPIHFFWGSFDLVVTRFSGRRAPLHPGGAPGLPDDVTREAYSHECSSAGFWPGNGGLGYPAYYSYAYPEPEGYANYPVGPEGAFYNKDMKIFILPYDKVRLAPDPDAALFQFLENTYDAAAETGRWDRAVLECQPGVPLHPRAVS